LSFRNLLFLEFSTRRQSPFFFENNGRIADLALRHRLPSLSGEPNSAEAGALLFYGPNILEGCQRHLMGARNRRGFGWKRWSTAWLYDVLGLFADYRVRYLARA
jgi:hypothetical protein